MSRYNSDKECCATCQRWAGGRDIHFNNGIADGVECDSSGDCIAKNSIKSASSGCNAYTIWLDLLTITFHNNSVDIER